MRIFEAAHRAQVGAEQLRLDHVFAVERQRRLRQHAADGPNRQSLDVPVLGSILPNAEGFGGDADLGIADGERAHLASGADISLQQHGRNAQHVGDVVEPVGRVVGRQQRGRVDLQRQQVANGVGVLGAIQPVHELAARIGTRGGGPVQRGAQPADQPLTGGAVGLRNALRRHHAHAHLADHLLPDVRCLGRLGEIQAFERQPAGLGASVMAGDAGPLDGGAVGRSGCDRVLCRRAYRWGRGWGLRGQSGIDAGPADRRQRHGPEPFGRSLHHRSLQLFATRNFVRGVMVDSTPARGRTRQKNDTSLASES